ncbi:ATP-binding protein [Streptomyces alfalfae]|uniref:ATP-binding protein n=1 Tax=Streptomyces alfalfae TaxID=1642299 RepID=UPI0009A24889|nr:ATP-binding protein [Streptomyces alfalfae]AYA15486.1 ATP-binding protein [Streptomyces fradiae]RXX43849.1 ATP-binding protein [Streptomyces alfalfae]RZM99955.1 ATP-binding protein [Streptomyces alfalfae]
MGAPRRGTIADRVHATRDELFVGREAELRLLRDALAGTPGAPTVLYVHGPGGIGKTALLRRYAQEARAAGRPVVHVDGRTVPGTPPAFEAAAAGAREPGTLLLIDTFEQCQDLEGWLHEEFLLDLPEDTVVVVAGRLAPDVRWSADPGWAGLLAPVPLGDLDAGEARRLLVRKGVAADRHQPLLAFAAGHPLALVLAAHVAGTENAGLVAPGDWTPAPETIAHLLRQVLGALPGPRHRLALEICAQAHLTTETLLRAVAGEDAPELFSWLRDQPYVEHCAQGLFPHDVVREALAADLRWRDPDGYDRLYRRIHAHLLDRVGTASADGLLHAVGALQFLYRSQGHMAESHGWHTPGLVEDRPYDPSLRAGVLALAEEGEGGESAEVVRYWLDARPQDFRVQRLRGRTRAAAFSAWLRPAPFQGRAEDPVTAAAWEHAAAHGPLAPGESIALGRFHVHPQHYQRPSPVMDLMLWRMFGELLRDARPSWSFIVLRDDGFWDAHMEFCDMTPLPRPVTVGGSAYRLFAHDWRDTPPGAWLAGKQEDMLTGAGGGLTVDPIASGPRGELAGPWPHGEGDGLAATGTPTPDRAEFAAAVRSALRDLRRPSALAANPLRASRLVAGHGMSLREVLTNAIATLVTDRDGDRTHRAATMAFLEGAPTQEAAARRLGLPYSTYRRHLAAATARIEEIMWRHEEEGRPLSPP